MPGIHETSASKRVFTESAAPGTPASGYFYIYAKTDGKLYTKNDAGVESTISGLTASDIPIVDAGGYLTATNVETALQEAMAEVDANTALAHAEDHATRHSDGGADEITVENLATSAVNTDHALKPDGLGGVAFGAVSAVGAIDDLSDVDTDKSKTPADGDVLTYDGTDWNAEAASGGGGSALTVTDESGTVSDTAVTSITVPDGTLVDNGTGDVTIREVPTGVVGASLYQSSDQSIPNATPTSVTFDAEYFDTDSIHDASSDTERMTVPAGMGGKWYVQGQVRFDGLTDGNRVYLSLYHYRSSAVRMAFDDTLVGGTYQVVTVSAIIDAQAGDYFYMSVSQSEGSANDTVAADTTFSAIKLGSGTVGETIGASVYNNGTESIASAGGVQPSFDSEDWDSDGFHSTSTNTSRLTVPAGLGGKYLVRGNVFWEGNATGIRQANILVNGSAVVAARERVVASTTDNLMTNPVCFLDLDAGDYVELQVYQNSGSALTVGHASTRDVQTEFGMVLLATQGAEEAVDFAQGRDDSVLSVATSTWTTVPYDNALDDDDSLLDTSSNVGRFTVARSGVYLLSASGLWAANSTGIRRMRAYVDGAVIDGANNGYCNPTTAAAYLQYHHVVRLTAGQYVEFQVWQDSGGNLNFGDATASPAGTTAVGSVTRIGP